MVKNTQGGNKAKSKAHKDFTPKTKNMNELFKTEGQEYAYVIDSFSNKNCRVMCFDKKQRDAIVRGKIEGRVKPKRGDILLISLRSFQDSKCDVLLKYDLEDINFLLNNNAITRSFVQNGGGAVESTGIVFGETKKTDISDIMPEGEEGDLTGELLDDMDLIPMKKPVEIKLQTIEIPEENGSMLLNIDDI
jgi:translation initiation factor 1A